LLVKVKVKVCAVVTGFVVCCLLVAGWLLWLLVAGCSLSLSLLLLGESVVLKRTLTSF
jgi:hypothetical protein